jgi:hypothetical protein
MSGKAAAAYFKAVDKMRRSPDGPLITGILIAAHSPGSTRNMLRVGNKGAGSVAEAYEIVAAAQLLDDGVLTIDDIIAFGEKLDTSGLPIPPNTIEADLWLTNRRFMDMKFSADGNPFISETQLRNLETVLSNANSPIDSATFVVNRGLDTDTENLIKTINANIRTERARLGLPAGEDLIKVKVVEWDPGPPNVP